MTAQESTEKEIRNIHRQTRKKYSAEEKIRIELDNPKRRKILKNCT